MSNPWPPPIFTDCSPTCDSVSGARVASGPCAGRVAWTVQCKQDPSLDAVSPSVGWPIEMRLTMVDPTAPVPGETYCWSGAWISFPVYNTPTVTWCGDILYLPYHVGHCYVMEARQRADGSGTSETATCQLCIGRSSGGQIVLDELRFRSHSAGGVV